MNECKCGRPTRDDAYVCETDLDDFAKVLGDVTWLDDELETSITKAHGVDYSAATVSGNETPMIFNVAASEARDGLRHELALLVRFCSEEGVRASDPSDNLPDDNIIAMSRWLLWRVDGLAFNDMADEFITAVTSAVVKCERIIDRPPERKYAGPCSECKRDLYHRPGVQEVSCAGCGTRWNLAEVEAWMRGQVEEHMEGKLVTVQEGATLLNRLGIETPVRAIYAWAADGRLAETGIDAKKRRLYRWDDLVPLATGRVAS